MAATWSAGDAHRPLMLDPTAAVYRLQPDGCEDCYLARALGIGSVLRFRWGRARWKRKRMLYPSRVLAEQKVTTKRRASGGARRSRRRARRLRAPTSRKEAGAVLERHSAHPNGERRGWEGLERPQLPVAVAELHGRDRAKGDGGRRSARGRRTRSGRGGNERAERDGERLG